MSEHTHPKPTQYRLSQWISGALLVTIVIAAPAQVLLGVLVNGGFLFIITGVITATLALPVVMQTAATPPVTATDDGLTLHPYLWGERTVRWDEVVAIRRYTLLPPEDAEVVRRYATGRKKYTPAEGIMLLVPSLPLPYRVTGFFAGASGQPVVALTNRSHTDYARLKKIVMRHVDATIATE